MVSISRRQCSRLCSPSPSDCGRGNGGRKFDWAHQELQKGRCRRGTWFGKCRPGAKVVEAKEDASYDLAAALVEMETARQNRTPKAGCSCSRRRPLRRGLEPLLCYGNDVVVVWDADDPATDTHLRLGLSVARASVRGKRWSGAALTWILPQSIRHS